MKKFKVQKARKLWNSDRFCASNRSDFFGDDPQEVGDTVMTKYVAGAHAMQRNIFCHPIVFD